jgi:phosphatidylinositol alpha-1,6-mannosyltransferase
LKAKIGISKSNFVILSVSRLTIEKGIDDVMKAIAHLDKSLSQRIKYIIVGQGPAIKYLRNLHRQLGLNKKITFLGKIPNTNLISLYDMCDIFVLPSRRGASESFGRVFVEAAARSKTSIAANTGGMLDIIQDGKTGFLVDPSDVEALGKSIKILASNYKITKHMGSLAKLEARRKYTRPVIAAQLQMYLEKAVSVS